MEYLETIDIDHGDMVKNKYNDVIGMVIGVFYNKGKAFLDVRTERRVYAYSPALTWELLPKDSVYYLNANIRGASK